MTPAVEKHHVLEANASKFLHWIRHRGGVAVWKSINLSDPGKSWSTPFLKENGEPTPKPHWGAESQASRVITNPDDILVDTPHEVKRFRVAIRRGTQGLSFKLTDASSSRLRKEVDKAGEGAWYEFDYGSQEAVIYVAKGSMSLKEWGNKYAV